MHTRGRVVKVFTQGRSSKRVIAGQSTQRVNRRLGTTCTQRSGVRRRRQRLVTVTISRIRHHAAIVNLRSTVLILRRLIRGSSIRLKIVSGGRRELFTLRNLSKVNVNRSHANFYLDTTRWLSDTTGTLVSHLTVGTGTAGAYHRTRMLVTQGGYKVGNVKCLARTANRIVKKGVERGNRGLITTVTRGLIDQAGATTCNYHRDARHGITNVATAHVIRSPGVVGISRHGTNVRANTSRLFLMVPTVIRAHRRINMSGILFYDLLLVSQARRRRSVELTLSL